MKENQMATCSNCGKDFEETEVNMVDYEIDLCIKCEKEYEIR